MWTVTGPPVIHPRKTTLPYRQRSSRSPEVWHSYPATLRFSPDNELSTMGNWAFGNFGAQSLGSLGLV